MSDTLTLSVVEHPILFSGPMVRAIQDGTKTQTRRTRGLDRINEQPNGYEFTGWGPTGAALFRLKGSEAIAPLMCPYGQPGDRLWVRETALYLSIAGGPDRDIMYADHEDYDVCYPSKDSTFDLGWRVVPSIFMPRWASRLTLELTAARVERVRDISILDAHAEGVDEWGHGLPTERERDEQRNRTAVENYALLWDALNAKRGYGWDVNPWVWVLEFAKVAA